MPTTYTQVTPYAASDYSSLVADKLPLRAGVVAVSYEMLWSRDGYRSGAATTISSLSGSLLEIKELGWSELQALKTRVRLESFAEDWEAPGMEAYDEL
ncbi:hypothetical protein U5801_17705 [Lamprobacter modestohalophilus]|uniref:hypothetical protein n=1 Tax=Lamprobacter modestohalophilus TaxID=1064514 RepID=UPI002ADEE39F|nr:hypothetical protein [Lamprobacter modestohalophilus]MEA1051625.1 hypothetical protein [Lamprobacter modestohalophilus]